MRQDGVQEMLDALRLVARGFRSRRLKDQSIALTGKDGPTLEIQSLSEIVNNAVAIGEALIAKDATP